jgi:hypothetical protein
MAAQAAVSIDPFERLWGLSRWTLPPIEPDRALYPNPSVTVNFCFFDPSSYVGPDSGNVIPGWQCGIFFNPDPYPSPLYSVTGTDVEDWPQVLDALCAEQAGGTCPGQVYSVSGWASSTSDPLGCQANSDFDIPCFPYNNTFVIDAYGDAVPPGANVDECCLGLVDMGNGGYLQLQEHMPDMTPAQFAAAQRQVNLSCSQDYAFDSPLCNTWYFGLPNPFQDQPFCQGYGDNGVHKFLDPASVCFSLSQLHTAYAVLQDRRTAGLAYIEAEVDRFCSTEGSTDEHCLCMV